MAKIQSVAFDSNVSESLSPIEYGVGWPVVYIINNDKEAYIGETVNMSTRAKQHYANSQRKPLNTLNVISNDDFNKSVILDLEGFLIKHMAADEKFVLQNGNMGIQEHNYYQQKEYEKTFAEIWQELKEKELTRQSLAEIQNSDIFKYSPYKALNLEQYKVINKVVEILLENQDTGKKSTVVVNGGAGTGKTVVAVYLMKILSETSSNLEFDEEMDPGYLYVAENLSKLKEMKIGLVIPMQSLRATIKKVFKNVQSLKPSMVISTIDVPKDEYDLLIVDEAHRLRQRKALSQYPAFDKNNKQLGFGNEGNELDWIMKCSKNQIFFYDSMQSVKPADIPKSRFDELIKDNQDNFMELKSQFRCEGGNDYIDYIKDILDVKKDIQPKSIQNYDFKIFNHLEDLIEAIKEKDKEYGLCRVVAGFSWKWTSKNDKSAYDICIEGKNYRWNTQNTDWVNSKNALDEIGCIHTVQGYDLNYVGIIFGNEIGYDEEKGEIIIDKNKYFDQLGKTAVESREALKEYIVNIYKTLLTRGVKGAYVYACNESLAKYLYNYILERG